MARFTIKLPSEVSQYVKETKKSIGDKVRSNELPDYRTFVTNLTKDMNTPAEELHHMGSGIAGEAGELLDISKKVWVYEKPLDVGHLLEELGDLRFYYQGVLNMLGLTDDDIVALNMEKLRKRYATGKYSNEQAIARADKAIGEGKGAEKPERKFMGQTPFPTEEQVRGVPHGAGAGALSGNGGIPKDGE